MPAEACKDVDQLLWSLNDLSITVTTRGAATDDEKKWTLEQKDKFFAGLGAHAELLPVLRTVQAQVLWMEVCAVAVLQAGVLQLRR